MVPEVKDFATFYQEVISIINEAESKGVVLRLMGGAAIKYHCPNSEDLYSALKRSTNMDKDFITYGRNRSRSVVRQILTDRGYTPYKGLALMGPIGKYRQIYNDSNGNKAIDVFFEKLPMCQEIVIENRERLEKDRPTWPLAELLLQKLQIVKLNEKDVHDIIILLREHDVGEGDVETVNTSVITRTLCDDWEFWYTVTQNIPKIGDFLVEYAKQGLISHDIAQDVQQNLTSLLNYHPKTFKWKSRSIFGTKKQWYRDVEEVQRDNLSQ